GRDGQSIGSRAGPHRRVRFDVAADSMLAKMPRVIARDRRTLSCNATVCHGAESAVERPLTKARSQPPSSRISCRRINMSRGRGDGRDSIEITRENACQSPSSATKAELLCWGAGIANSLRQRRIAMSIRHVRVGMTAGLLATALVVFVSAKGRAQGAATGLPEKGEVTLVGCFTQATVEHREEYVLAHPTMGAATSVP